MKNKLTLVLASTAVVGGIALGASAIPAMASTTSPTPSASSSSAATGTDDATRLADITARITSDLAGLVSDGTITQDQADKVASTLAGKVPAGGGHGGRGGEPGRGGMGGGMAGLSTAASAIGVTEDALRAQLEAGKSVADVAKAEGVSEQTVIDAIVADIKAHFAAEIASGEHTQAEVDARLADLNARVTTMVETQGLPQRGGPGPDGGNGPMTPNSTTYSSATAGSAA
jgi:hypothetical protein